MTMNKAAAQGVHTIPACSKIYQKLSSLVILKFLQTSCAYSTAVLALKCSHLAKGICNSRQAISKSKNNLKVSFLVKLLFRCVVV